MRVKEKFGLKNYQKKVWSITVWVVQGDPIKMRLGFCSIALAILIQQDLGKLSKLKSGEIWETVQRGYEPPPP